MHGVCCVFRVLMMILILWAETRSISAEERWNNNKDSTHYFKVNGTMGYINQQVIVEYKADTSKQATGKEDSFTLWCNSHPEQIDYKLSPDDPALPTMPRLLKVKTVIIQGCTVPVNSSYKDVLENLNVSFIENEDTTLKLLEMFAEPRLEGYHMEGQPLLSIKTLVITAANGNIHRPKFDFLDKMQELHTLELKEGVVLEKDVIGHLPEGLVKLTLEGTQLPAAESKLNNGSFWLQRLRSLTSLYLEEYISPESAEFKLTLPPFASLPNLIEANLTKVPMEPLRDNWLKGSKLQTLKMTECGIQTLPVNLFSGANLTKVTLNNMKLSSLPPEVFSPLQWLNELDLSSNDLNSVDFVNYMSPKKTLEILKLNNNPRLGSLCGDKHILAGSHNSQLPSSLRHLELNETGATHICNDWTTGKYDFLMYINLDFNNISNLEFKDLMMKRDQSMKNTPVNLSLKNNPLKRIDVTRDDYDHCLDSENDWGNPIPVKVNLILNKLACDCYKGYWLHETLRDCSLLTLPDVACHPDPDDPPAFKPKPLLDHERQDFTCHYVDFCTPGCDCWKRAFDNATVMRCSEALPLQPQWPLESKWPLVLYVPPDKLTTVPSLKLVEFYAPYNNITRIEEKDIPDTLLKLDVSNNTIKHITPEAAQKLVNQQTSTWISGNPLACGCEDAPAVARLKLAEVQDWNSSRCADGILLAKKYIDNCDSKDQVITYVVISIFLLLSCIIFALLLRHRLPKIRQYLFDHNMCLKWVLNVKDDHNDPMKTHDVFISYSYSDYQYAKKLIEKLEEHGYSTIEHCRDWLPGESISRQIAHSVMSARRTLLLVSDNFANSKWGLQEFHTAHEHAMEHGSARVIVVRCKLLAPQELPQELQLYLYNNTYLDWSDSYFWDKLWRVMPSPRPTPTSAIALIPNQERLPAIRIQLTPQDTNASSSSQLWLSVDKDPPLSELVLVPTVPAEDSPLQPSVRTLPITPVTRPSPSSSEKNSSFSCKIQCESVPVTPAGVSPCVC